MLAVHFGAGNIGRGFIGGVLVQAGYEVCFVDVNAQVVEELNRKHMYQVTLASEESTTYQVEHVRARNSMTEVEAITEEIANADVITTAVGPTILVRIAPLIREGLKRRMACKAAPLNIIACENMVGGSQTLREYVLSTLNDQERQWIDAHVSFPNAAVDRIVPIQSNPDLLSVSVEPYYEWVIDQSQFIGDASAIRGAKFVPNLLPFIERKLFTVNSGHAAAAYFGFALQIPTIYQAMCDSSVEQFVRGVLAETGKMIVHTYSFDPKEHDDYVQKIIARFKNPYINDEVIRVARGPIRKLGPQERLIRPAMQYYALFNEVPEHLAQLIAYVLCYKNEEDEESVRLQQIIAENGYASALQEISLVPEHHPLAQRVLRILKG